MIRKRLSLAYESSYDSWKGTDVAGDHLLSLAPQPMRGPAVPSPGPRCRKLMLCSQAMYHLGDCDMKESLELVPMGTMKGFTKVC